MGQPTIEPQSIFVVSAEMGCWTGCSLTSRSKSRSSWGVSINTTSSISEAPTACSAVRGGGPPSAGPFRQGGCLDKWKRKETRAGKGLVLDPRTGALEQRDGPERQRRRGGGAAEAGVKDKIAVYGSYELQRTLIEPTWVPRDLARARGNGASVAPAGASSSRRPLRPAPATGSRYTTMSLWTLD